MSVNSILDANDNFAAKLTFKCHSLSISFVGAVDTILPGMYRHLMFSFYEILKVMLWFMVFDTVFSKGK